MDTTLFPTDLSTPSLLRAQELVRQRAVPSWLHPGTGTVDMLERCRMADMRWQLLRRVAGTHPGHNHPHAGYAHRQGACHTPVGGWNAMIKMDKKLQIRNSTAEFLIFTTQSGADGIEVRYEDETIWLTQKLMAALFDVTIPTVNEHLKNIFAGGELQQDSVIRKFRTTASDGKNYNTNFYNIDAIISVGYRVNSKRATQFRQWATWVLREFAVKGYVLDRKRMENGSFLGEDYFERLLEEIREIRLSERRFYQKITDIYATSVDYNKDAPTIRELGSALPKSR